uniref:Immunoglobulin domain protein n=1 Tax=Caenorhabditis tropicalis TaxID=1561998 RepID=A0A1I7USJ0_9PELO
MLNKAILVASFALAYSYPHPEKTEDAVKNLILEIDLAHLTSKPMLKFTDNFASKEKHATGETIVLRCEILSIPSAVVYWQKDGKLIQGDTNLNLYEKMANVGKKIVESGIVSSTLSIPCASHKDAGVYKCIAANGHKTIETTTVLEIEGDDKQCPSTHHTPPRITLQSESRFEMAGNTATLLCRADKKAKWSWEFEGEVLDMNKNKYEVLPTGDLVIRDIEWEDMGEYFCTASNKYGEARGETFLYPTKKRD